MYNWKQVRNVWKMVIESGICPSSEPIELVLLAIISLIMNRLLQKDAAFYLIFRLVYLKKFEENIKLEYITRCCETLVIWWINWWVANCICSNCFWYRHSWYFIQPSGCRNTFSYRKDYTKLGMPIIFKIYNYIIIEDNIRNIHNITSWKQNNCLLFIYEWMWKEAMFRSHTLMIIFVTWYWFSYFKHFKVAIPVFW